MKKLLVFVIFILFLSMPLYAAEDSKGFNVDVVLTSTATMSGNPVTVPGRDNIKIEAHVVEIAPKSGIGKHSHPYPVLTYVLSGSVEVENEDGTKKTFEAGESFIEDANTWVINRNTGDETLKFLAVLYAGKDQKTFTLKE
ncbi:MAG: cupin domain-containing protein [Candidatus Dadabacteria bacterium]|nr:cupin domain-containing protein [Candidatus Dadabacteria bacterium]NIS08837.1 cupin domain-containing protein [Candidatus Dadabacteria bacterium]NIY22187.1 cupin domain-containing protein [Candidatus Dadabacteria bacterium]